ncbi:MAG: D-alanine--D-alanine ligase family protein [Patescibacteria group bacterium]
MKILILTRNIIEMTENGGKQMNEKVESYGRDNIKDALGVKRALGNLHETKVLPISDDFYFQLRIEKPDVVFNMCDDGFRNDPTLEPHVAAMLDVLNVPYTGNNYFTLALCQHKVRTKDILTFNNILTPRFQVFTSAERKLDPELKFPMIVKPIREDGSIGIRERSVVNNGEQLKEEVDHIINIYRQEALVEEFIDGREFTVSLIGNRRPIVLPVAEIDFSGMPAHLPKIVSYRAKWIKQSIAYKHTPIICPVNIDEKMNKLIEETARKCYKILGCRGYARIDFRYDEKEKKLYALEVNPNPDISEDFDVAKSAIAAGMSYSDLLQKIIDFALEKRY